MIQAAPLAIVSEIIDEMLARHRAEGKLRRLQHEFDAREKFIFSLTHDLRTPLTAAKIHAQLIADGRVDTEMTCQLAHRISHSIDRADRMLTDLLDANRIRSGRALPVFPTECDLSEAVAEAVDDLPSTDQERCIPRIENNVTGYWDQNAIRRAVDNLVRNAFKYGDPEKEVTVRLTVSDNMAVIAVHNYGRELSQREQKSLFQWFQQTESALRSDKPGWGLGLMIVKAVAEAHGGEVRVESGKGKGTTFSIHLPIRRL